MAIESASPAWLAVPDDANALAAAVWPAGAGRDAEGRLTLGGLPLDALAARFGTPLLVVDEDEVRARAVRIREVFITAFAGIGADVSVYYAGKAFLTTDIARWVAQSGLRIDVCSGGEFAVARAAGIDASRLGFHGNNKSPAEIRRAVDAGIGTIVIDSVHEIARVAAAAAAAAACRMFGCA